LKIYRTLSAAYGWTPAEISEMTLPQIDAYLISEEEVDASVEADAGPTPTLGTTMSYQALCSVVERRRLEQSMKG
jgi:hypothetical protein